MRRHTTGGRVGSTARCVDGLAGNARYDLKRVHIEETLAVKLHAGEHGVVERALHHIGIFAAVLVFKHLLREEHQTDGSAGLGVHGVVRQVIIRP